jgi:hypothetical protein
MIYYICENCGKRINETEIEESQFPESFARPKEIEAIKNYHLKKKNELDHPSIEITNDDKTISLISFNPPLTDFPIIKFHTKYDYVFSQYKKLACYPLHVENEQERFISWLGGDFELPKKSVVKYPYDPYRRYK